MHRDQERTTGSGSGASERRPGTGDRVPGTLDTPTWIEAAKPIAGGDLSDEFIDKPPAEHVHNCESVPVGPGNGSIIHREREGV